MCQSNSGTNKSKPKRVKNGTIPLDHSLPTSRRTLCLTRNSNRQNSWRRVVIEFQLYFDSTRLVATLLLMLGRNLIEVLFFTKDLKIQFGPPADLAAAQKWWCLSDRHHRFGTSRLLPHSVKHFKPRHGARPCNDFLMSQRYFT